MRDEIDNHHCAAELIEHAPEAGTTARSRHLCSESRGLNAAERRRLLVDWNQTQTPYPRDRCFHQLFAEQAARTPQAIAVESSGKRLTYEELEKHANRLAHQLQSLGVKPDALVGICLRPAVDLMVGLLAVMKAGGAYVPLDPIYPEERLAFMIRDSGMKVLITQQTLVERMPSDDLEVVCVDGLHSSREFPAAPPQSGVTPESLAYVMYTSGSTGRPKGVMVPHRGLVNYLTWAADAYQVRAGTGAPVHSSISFDLSITGLFTSLLVGRCVRIVPAGQGLETLANVLRQKENFSLIKITPAHLEMLCAQLSKDDAAAATRLFVVGGEALFSQGLGFWSKCAPDAVLVNEYGPTETVVGCCVYFVPKEGRPAGAIPIGRPIANTQLYVLDKNLAPVPTGETGELFVAGDGVARGYLNRPELTARIFLPNPFTADDPDASSTMYKTGDLVRYLPDGNLEYIGRIDDQIKIRSFRIEPAEIETALLAHSAVRHAAVVARTNPTGEKYLAAYFVCDGQPAPDVPELREFLKDKLPEYMIPTAFVVLSDFPLTANGKVDRSALPPAEIEVQEDYVAPRTEIERKVAEIWETAFQRSDIGLRDDFFEMGGHSLLAVRLVSQINDVFKSDLEAGVFLEHSTVETLAQALNRDTVESPEAKLIPIRAGGDDPAIFFLNTPFEFIQLASQTESHPVFASQVPWAPELLEASSRFDSRSFPTVAAMAQPHAELIAACVSSRSSVIAGYSYGGVLAFEVAHQLIRRGHAVDAVILFDTDIKPPFWQLRKHRLRLHWDRTRENGLGYLWRAAQARVARHFGRRNNLNPASVRPPANELDEADARWHLIDRIWKHALKRYRRRPLPTHGILFRAQETVFDFSQDYDGKLGWSHLFAEGVEMIKVPGDHDSMWKDPQLHDLGRAWQTSLGLLRRKAETALCLSPTVLALVSTVLD